MKFGITFSGTTLINSVTQLTDYMFDSLGRQAIAMLSVRLVDYETFN